jgi:hypothetical protein
MKIATKQRGKDGPVGKVLDRLIFINGTGGKRQGIQIKNGKNSPKGAAK